MKIAQLIIKNFRGIKELKEMFFDKAFIPRAGFQKQVSFMVEGSLIRKTSNVFLKIRSTPERLSTKTKFMRDSINQS